MRIIPRLFPLLNSQQERLIDSDIFHDLASKIGQKERYSRGKTTHTVHVWWARRPHSSMRALVFSTLCKNNDIEFRDVFANLIQDISIPAEIQYIRSKLLSQYEEKPRVLDMFGGGGTIPFESCALGADAYSIDINQLSVFIQQSNLSYFQKTLKSKIYEQINESGIRVLNNLTKSTQSLFPLRATNIVTYIWTYSTVCVKCQFEFTLSKRRYLSRKKAKNRFIGMFYRKQGMHETMTIEENFDINKMHNSHWLARHKVRCPNCGTKMKISFDKAKEKLVILVKKKEKTGKDFITASTTSIPNQEELNNKILEIIKHLDITLPDSTIPNWSGIVNPGTYGMKTHKEIFNQRQQIVMLLLIEELRKEFKLVSSLVNETEAKIVVGVLSSFIDQLVDWNCRLSMWIPENEQIGRAFCGPGIAMIWDYAEIDPLLKGPANLWGKLNRILKSLEINQHNTGTAHVFHGIAQQLPFNDEYFDAIITDPPYYDNIFYSVLSDFFYVWKRLLLQNVDKLMFKSATTDFSKELVATKYRHADTQSAHNSFIKEFIKVINEAERVLKLSGIFSLIYSHNSIAGWEPIVIAYRQSNLIINCVQPLNIERKHRPRSMNANTSNSCVVIVSRKTDCTKISIKYTDIKQQFIQICNVMVPSLQSLNWSPIEIGIPVFATGVGLLANHSKIFDEKQEIINVMTALSLFAQIVADFVSGFKLKNRKSM